MATTSLLILIFSIIAVSFTAATNITDLLSAYPEYSDFNKYLTETKIADEINTRSTITVLVVTNSALTSLAKYPLSVIKSALSLHVLLDYYDPKKLHDISDGTTLSTTLYQTTGNAKDKLGFVNITDLKGGKVGFGSAIPGAPLDSTYTKSVKSVPYNFSVLEISAPIIVKQILDAPSNDVNLTAVLEKAGCKTFADLIVRTGVIKVYSTALAKGLTVFAPNDEAFKAKGLPDLSKLSNAELVSLLQFHALASYTPIGTLKSSKDPISTLATNGVGKYDLSVQTAGDSVSLSTGLDTSRIASTVMDTPPSVVFTVDSILLPPELFGEAPAPAPGPAPSPADLSPSPAPGSAEAPSPFPSPPAPPPESADGSPADAPGGDESEDSTAHNSAGVKSPAIAVVVVTVAVSAIMSVLLS